MIHAITRNRIGAMMDVLHGSICDSIKYLQRSQDLKSRKHLRFHARCKGSHRQKFLLLPIMVMRLTRVDLGSWADVLEARVVDSLAEERVGVGVST
jgi:hypothetical protein